jgi:hypothetical protein
LNLPTQWRLTAPAGETPAVPAAATPAVVACLITYYRSRGKGYGMEGKIAYFKELSDKPEIFQLPHDQLSRLIVTRV